MEFLLLQFFSPSFAVVLVHDVFPRPAPEGARGYKLIKGALN